MEASVRPGMANLPAFRPRPLRWCLAQHVHPPASRTHGRHVRPQVSALSSLLPRPLLPASTRTGAGGRQCGAGPTRAAAPRRPARCLARPPRAGTAPRCFPQMRGEMPHAAAAVSSPSPPSSSATHCKGRDRQDLFRPVIVTFHPSRLIRPSLPSRLRRASRPSRPVPDAGGRTSSGRSS